MQLRIVYPGAVSRLRELVDRFGQAGPTLVVAGVKSFAAIDGPRLVGRLGTDLRIVHARGDLPRIEHYDRLREEIGPEPIGCIVAMGGGRVLDVAKLLSTDFRSSAEFQPVMRGTAAAVRRVPLVAVPTTAGSGSESTPFAVTYSEGRKYSVDHPSILPDAAIVDSRLLQELPKRVIATSGLDVVCQCIEALLSSGATAYTEAVARRGLLLAQASLARGIQRDPSALHQLSLAANLAGRAIAVTRTTIPHSLSYVLSHDYGVAHGHAVALSMGRYLEHFGRALQSDRRLKAWAGSHAFVLDTLDCRARGRVPVVWDNFVARLGLPASIAACGLGPDAPERAALGVDPIRMRNSPLSLDRNELSGLFA